MILYLFDRTNIALAHWRVHESEFEPNLAQRTMAGKKPCEFGDLMPCVNSLAEFDAVLRVWFVQDAA